jgi:hypothetical protein
MIWDTEPKPGTTEPETGAAVEAAVEAEAEAGTMDTEKSPSWHRLMMMDR